MNNLLEYMSSISSEMDRISCELQSIDYRTKELEIAIQKIQEAIFWLTFFEEDLEEEKTNGY